MTIIRNWIAAGIFGAIILTGAVAAISNKGTETVAAKADVALNGVDPVSYFQGDGKPVAGSASYTVELDGKNYRFANQQNADAFKENPVSFLPQYGGHCAWAAAKGSIAPGDPAYYRVVDGKLYLNYNAEVQNNWVADISGFIAKADANWPRLKSSS